MALPPSRPGLRERYDRRHAELVDRAAARFALTGYGTTTMAELAASMGLATGALYHYFGSKDELLRAICDELMEPLLQRAREPSGDPADPAEELRALVRLWVTQVCTHRDHMRVFQQQRHVIESGERWRSVRASRKAFERRVAEVLAAAGPSGDPELARLALLGMVNHTAQWYRPRGPLRPEQIADGYVELVLAAGGGAPDPGRDPISRPRRGRSARTAG